MILFNIYFWKKYIITYLLSHNSELISTQDFLNQWPIRFKQLYSFATGEQQMAEEYLSLSERSYLAISFINNSVIFGQSIRNSFKTEKNLAAKILN